jgi:hypothetical protein
VFGVTPAWCAAVAIVINVAIHHLRDCLILTPLSTAVSMSPTRGGLVVTKFSDAVGTVLDEVAPLDFRPERGGRRTVRRVLKEREAVRAALKFANTGNLRAMAVLVSGMPLPSGALADADWQTRADADSAQRFGAERAELQADLANIIDGRVSSDDVARLERDAVRLIKVPSERGDGDHYVPESPRAMLAHVVQVIRNPRNPYARDLYRCQLASCGHPFFLASDKSPQTGKPRTKFCSKEHMLDAHAAGSTARVRASREARAKGAATAAKHK